VRRRAFALEGAGHVFREALQKLLHKPFRISESFGAVSRPFGLRVKRSQALIKDIPQERIPKRLVSEPSAGEKS